MIKLPVKKTHHNARLPRKAYQLDAGFDLFAIPEGPTTVNIHPGCNYHVDTGIAMSIPDGYFMLIKERSGMAFRQGVHVLAGIIDAGFLGTIIVILHNDSPNIVTIDLTKAIAQGLILPVPEVIIEGVSELPTTKRGQNGFGSSDTK
jgi:dUTP pyrophosphatase